MSDASQEEKGHEPLLHAGRQGDLDLVQTLWEQAVQLQTPAPSRALDLLGTLAAAAATNGHGKVVMWLLKKARKIVIDHNQTSLAVLLKDELLLVREKAALVALRGGHVEVALSAMGRGEDGTNTLSTMALRAADAGMWKVVSEVIETDSSIAKTQGLLRKAAARGDADIVRALVERGAPLNAGPTTKDSMAVACSAGNWAVVELLALAGARVPHLPTLLEKSGDLPRMKEAKGSANTQWMVRHGTLRLLHASNGHAISHTAASRRDPTGAAAVDPAKVVRAPYGDLLSVLLSCLSSVELRQYSTVVFPYLQRNSYVFLEVCWWRVQQSAEPLATCQRMYEVCHRLSHANVALQSVFEVAARRFGEETARLWTATNEAVVQSGFSPSFVLEQPMQQLFPAARPDQSQGLVDRAIRSRNFDLMKSPDLVRCVERWWMGWPTSGTFHDPDQEPVIVRICGMERAYDLNQPGNPAFFKLLLPFRLFRAARTKFVLDMLSFLLLTVAVSISAAEANELHAPVTGAEITVMLQGAGIFVAEMGQMWYFGLGTYTQSGWNYVDLGICSAVLVMAMCRLSTWTDNADSTARMQALYLTVMPILSLLSWFRLLFLYAFFSSLGPLLASLKKMVGDIVNFGMLLVIFLFAFYFSVLFLVGGLDLPQGQLGGFDSPHQALVTMLQLSFAGDVTDTFDTLSQTRQILMQIVTTSYLLLTTVVLINILIAMMSSTFDLVRSHAAAESTRLRMELFRSYDHAPSLLPPPLNLLVVAVYPVVWMVSYQLSGASSAVTLHCAYCGGRWDQRLERADSLTALLPSQGPFYTKPTMGLIQRGLLCDCGRTKRLLPFQLYVLQLVSSCLFAVVYLPVWLLAMCGFALVFSLDHAACCTVCRRLGWCRRGRPAASVPVAPAQQANSGAELQGQPQWLPELVLLPMRNAASSVRRAAAASNHNTMAADQRTEETRLQQEQVRVQERRQDTREESKRHTHSVLKQKETRQVRGPTASLAIRPEETEEEAAAAPSFEESMQLPPIGGGADVIELTAPPLPPADHA